MTGEEKNVHERAVKLRKMTDDKLVEHIDHIREEAYNTGYSEAEAQRASAPAPGKTPAAAPRAARRRRVQGHQERDRLQNRRVRPRAGLPRMSGPVKDPLRALQGARSRAQGGRLEEQIEASCALLTETGRADISKTPEPMKPVSQPNKSGQFRAVYTKKAEPDFKGVMLGGRAVMFEAKSTGTGRLNKDRVLPEQVKKLDSYTALGAHCFIVATFDGLRVYRIPWTVWRSMKQRYGRNYVTEADIKEYAVRFGPGFTPDLLRGIPTMYGINPLSNVSDVLTAFCGMPYGTQPETEEWRAAVYRFSRFMDWTTPERFMLVNEIRREQPNMENPIFSFMGVPITEDSAGKLKEAMKKCGVSALEVAGVCERFAKIARATLDELPDGNKEEEHDD